MTKDVFSLDKAIMVDELRNDIDKLCRFFLANSAKATNKAGAKKARNNTIALGKLMKEYRKISIKSNQTKEE